MVEEVREMRKSNTKLKNGFSAFFQQIEYRAFKDIK